jgi:hypothetical protein
MIKTVLSETFKEMHGEESASVNLFCVRFVCIHQVYYFHIKTSIMVEILNILAMQLKIFEKPLKITILTDSLIVTNLCLPNYNLKNILFITFMIYTFTSFLKFYPKNNFSITSKYPHVPLSNIICKTKTVLSRSKCPSHTIPHH